MCIRAHGWHSEFRKLKIKKNHLDSCENEFLDTMFINPIQSVCVTVWLLVLHFCVQLYNQYKVAFDIPFQFYFSIRLFLRRKLETAGGWGENPARQSSEYDFLLFNDLLHVLHLLFSAIVPFSIKQHKKKTSALHTGSSVIFPKNRAEQNRIGKCTNLVWLVPVLLCYNFPLFFLYNFVWFRMNSFWRFLSIYAFGWLTLFKGIGILFNFTNKSVSREWLQLSMCCYSFSNTSFEWM